MFTGNPVYDMSTVTPPGVEGWVSTFGSALAPFVGGVAHPYVPLNQSTGDAWVAKYVNDPNYRRMMSGVYGQMGYQLGNTLGGMDFVKSLATMSGYSPAQAKRELAGFGQGLGRSGVGQVLMPIADMLLDSAGISGGSFVQAATQVYSNRMNLLPAGQMFNPYDAGQQHSAMAGTSAMLNVLNGIISKKDKEGKMTALPDMAFTKGFDRGTIANLAMQVAGAGGFDTAAGGFADTMSLAAKGYDLGKLNYAEGDFTGGTKNLDKNTAAKVKRTHDLVKAQVADALEAMSAMRDMLHTVDGIQEKLTALTDGKWRSGGGAGASTASAIRRMNAVMQAYNLDPNATMEQMMQNRGLLQNAAGFDGAMQYFGFNGGGMFGISAQTELMASVEDMINARGARGNPIVADRLRKQGTQAIARNMNTQAGVAAQVLAYARQTGVLTDQAAEEFRAGLTSGDRSKMDDSINRMLTTVFGSSKRGRELMQDQMFVNSMRQSMNDEAGKYAMGTIIRGADKEWMQQEKATAAADRFAFSRSALARAGMRTMPSDADVGRLVKSISLTLAENEDGAQFGAAFEEQYASRIAKGMKPNAALQATISAFKRNPATAKYAEQIQTAYNRQSAENNEYAYRNGGLESGQAKAVADAMQAAGSMTSKQHAAITKMIRNGQGKEALAEVDRLSASLSPAQRSLFDKVRAEATKSYTSAVNAIDDKKIAEQLVDAAGKSGFGSNAISESYNGAVDAAKAFLASGKKQEDMEALTTALRKGRFSMIFGDEEQDKLISELQGPNAAAAIERMGRRSMQLKQLSTANLRKNGYDLKYNGYWGGGTYSGNSDEALKARDAVISKIAAGLKDESDKSQKDRQTVGQNIVDFLTGNGDWKSVLRIHDKTGTMKGMLAEYSTAYDDYEKAMEAYGKQEGGLKDAVKALNAAGKKDEARRLSTMFDKAGKYSEENLDTLIKNSGLGDKEAKALREAFKGRKDVVSKKESADKAMVSAAKKEGFSDAFKKMTINQRDAEERRKKYMEAGAYMDDLDVSSLATWSGKTVDRAYALAEKAVSNEEVAADLGVSSLKGVSAEVQRRTRLNLTKKKAESGDEKAVKAMEKFNVAANEGVTKIRGKLTVQIGNEQSPALLEGNIGTTA